MGRHVFICEDNNENILTAIFDAFTYRNRFRTDDIDIIVSKDGTYMAELLATYERVETDMSKAFKTMDAVRQKLGVEAHVSVLRVLCHYDDRRAYYIFRFLERCFRFGGDYAMKLSDEYVMKMMELSRKTWNEAHLFRGFVRFEETKGFLYATIDGLL